MGGFYGMRIMLMLLNTLGRNTLFSDYKEKNINLLKTFQQMPS